MALKLLVETIVGIALTIGWWILHFGILERLESRGIPRRAHTSYEIVVPVLVGLGAYFLLGNQWFCLAMASPFWLVYGFERLDRLDTWANTKAKRGGDYVWGALLVVIIIVLFIYVISPLSALQVTWNLVGLVLGIACGTITGTFLAIGALIGLKWKAHMDTGTVIGGTIGLLVPMILLTMVFDQVMVSISAPIGLRLYVVAFLPVCVIAAILVGSWLGEEKPVAKRAEGQA